MILYFIVAFFNLIVTLLGLILSPVLPLFSVQKEWWLDNHAKRGIGPVLPFWLNWFMTPDNSLDGDATFERLNGISYWSKVKWLCRNPAYSFAMQYIGAPYNIQIYGDPTIKDNDNAKKGWCFVKANGLFLFRWVQPIGFKRCILCNFGFNIMVLADPNVEPKPKLIQATFVFSPRISGFR